MCMDGACRFMMQDENVQRLMSNPGLDLIHKQVVMMLYSLDAGDRLGEYREVLPIYLSLTWDRVAEILRTLEDAGLVTLAPDRLLLTHPIKSDDSAMACVCRS